MSDLRNALHDLAEGQEFHPDPAAWDHGRRARRRSRIVAGVAALGVVAVVAGLGALATDTQKAIVPADHGVVPGGAIPSRIDALPEELTARLPGGGLEHEERPWDVGASSAAFITDGVPALITAKDGKYHSVGLPGWREESIALALSPDGTRLAWQDHDSEGSVLQSVDLETGQFFKRSVVPGERLRLRELVWSPNGQRLGWIGDGDPEGTWVGQWRVSGTASERSLLPGTVQDAAVSDLGHLVVSRASGGLFRVEGDKLARLSISKRVGAGGFSPGDGRYLALRSAPEQASFTLDTANDRVLAHQFPGDTFAEAVSRPLGWLDDRLQLLLVTPSDGGDPQYVVTTPAVDDTSTWRRGVGSVDPEVADSLTLAVDLIPALDGSSSQRLTHDFGEPEWPSERDMSWRIGLGVTAAVAVLLGLRWLARQLWRRRF